MAKSLISKLSKLSNRPYQTIYAYVNGTRSPNIKVARNLAELMGNCSDTEILIWMSGDSKKIKSLLDAWAKQQITA